MLYKINLSQKYIHRKLFIAKTRNINRHKNWGAKLFKVKQISKGDIDKIFNEHDK